MKKRFDAVVLWGALWGITEATLGYALHLLPVNPGWFVWFPVAYFFMRRVRGETGSNAAVLHTAAVAASVKFVNILMPGSIDRVVNPAASILLEAMCVYVLYRFIIRDNRTSWSEYAGAFGLSFLWRAPYVGYVLWLPDWMVRISPIASPQSLAEFLLLQSVTNGITIAAILLVFRQVRAWLITGERGNRATRSTPTSEGNGAWGMLKAAVPYCLLIVALVAQRML